MGDRRANRGDSGNAAERDALPARPEGGRFDPGVHRRAVFTYRDRLRARARVSGESPGTELIAQDRRQISWSRASAVAQRIGRYRNRARARTAGGRGVDDEEPAATDGG